MNSPRAAIKRWSLQHYIAHISEHVMTEEVAAHSDSAREWVGLPFLLLLNLVKYRRDPFVSQ